MPSLYNANLKPLEPGVFTHPYDHASKLFVADNLRLAPKQTFLYYISINIDVGILQNLLGGLGSLQEPASSQTLVEQYETGLLAKRVDLPKFSISTKNLNSYNRKNIIQTSISYEPITISFHDDAADTVNKFWNDYYTFYYRDSDYESGLYGVPHKYQPRLREGWGYSPRNGTLKNFLRNVQIFSLHNKRFTEYLLINPYITSWRHGTHESNSDNGTMENTMTLAYETVKYRTGTVNPVDVNGFAVLHYDNFNSPISDSITNIYTDAGVLGALDSGPKDLARPDGTGSGSGILGSILGAYRSFNQLKRANFKSLGSIVLGQVGASVINGAVQGAFNGIVAPTLGGSAGYGGVYGSSQVYQQSGIQNYSPYASPGTNFGTSLGAVVGGAAGVAINQITGAAIQNINQGVNNWVNGVVGPQVGPPTSVGANAINQMQGSGAIPIVVGVDGRPVTNQTTYTAYNQEGVAISTFNTTGDSTGTFDPNDPQKNLVSRGTWVQQDGQTMYSYNYADGTRRLVDAESEATTQIIPGSNYGKPVIPVSYASTRDQAAAGQVINPAATQYYTDRATGQTYVVNPTTAQQTNSFADFTGVIGGGLIGSATYKALAGTGLGKTVLGQAVAGAFSGAIGVATSRAINAGLTPIFNKISADFNQGIDNLTGSIQNKLGDFTGSGGYDQSNPLRNIVSQTQGPSGSNIFTYKDGTVRTVDAEGVQTVTAGTSAGFQWPTWGGTTPGISPDQNAAGAGYNNIWTDGSGNPVLSGDGSPWSTQFADSSTAFFRDDSAGDARFFRTGGYGDEVSFGPDLNPIGQSNFDTSGYEDYSTLGQGSAGGIDYFSEI